MQPLFLICRICRHFFQLWTDLCLEILHFCIHIFSIIFPSLWMFWKYSANCIMCDASTEAMRFNLARLWSQIHFQTFLDDFFWVISCFSSILHFNQFFEFSFYFFQIFFFRSLRRILKFSNNGALKLWRSRLIISKETNWKPTSVMSFAHFVVKGSITLVLMSSMSDFNDRHSALNDDETDSSFAFILAISSMNSDWSFSLIPYSDFLDNC